MKDTQGDVTDCIQRKNLNAASGIKLFVSNSLGQSDQSKVRSGCDEKYKAKGGERNEKDK